MTTANPETPEQPEPKVEADVLLEQGAEAATAPVLAQQKMWYEAVGQAEKEELAAIREDILSLKAQEEIILKDGNERRKQLALGRWKIYEQMGTKLKRAKMLVPEGSWLNYLESVKMDRTTAWRYITISNDPDTTLKESGGRLGQIKVSGDVSPDETPEPRPTSPNVILKATDHLVTHIEDGTMTPCCLCGALSRLYEKHPEFITNYCSFLDGCEFQELAHADDQKVAKKEKRQFLRDHPVYHYRNLVNAKGRVRSSTVFKLHKQHPDEIAQELGYERGTVERISNDPHYQNMNPTDKMYADIEALKRELFLRKRKKVVN